MRKPPTPEQVSRKEAEAKKAKDDPLNYKRKDPSLNAIDYLKLKLLVEPKSKRKGITSQQLREGLSKIRYGIPTTPELEGLREEKERAILSEAERQFRSSEVARPVRKGYEFQILK